MSALLSVGEANHAIMNADAELGAPLNALSQREHDAAIARARMQLANARAVLAAVRLALRSHALADALAYHEEMALRLREAAKAARMLPGRGLNLDADRHDTRARALRTLIGTATPPLTAHVP